MVVSAWNPGDLPRMALPPCHALWQVRILQGHLQPQLYQRSACIFLGVPFLSGFANEIRATMGGWTRPQATNFA
jgi:hypothetical protein